ncbi:MAG: hypothetical protein EA001_01445 [Oscillatoriales cyanobacterium]|nr:MAG: hypothetical protein EA001_01445 [Oscillatoriales cyanobacterium]
MGKVIAPLAVAYSVLGANLVSSTMSIGMSISMYIGMSNDMSIGFSYSQTRSLSPLFPTTIAVL